MRLPGFLKPQFFRSGKADAGPFGHSLDFRRVWRMAVSVTSVVTLAPLIFMALIELNVSRRATESEIDLRSSRLVSNTRRAVSHFIEERRAALGFVVRDNPIEDLQDIDRLQQILLNLKDSFGGFNDLGVIDPSGRQGAYVGHFNLAGVDYSAESWYQEVLERGFFISEVFLGHRQAPHFVIAIRHDELNGSSYVVRATIDTERFNDLLGHLSYSGQGDAFIVNRDGVLQTPSRYYGDALASIPFEVPRFSTRSEVVFDVQRHGQQLIVGYAYINLTPFVLMICQERAELTATWRRSRIQVLVFLAVSIVGILCVVVGVSNHLVQQIYEADQKRVATLHEIEYASKLASIGRLAAGVAHEINNPLAIINEKAGFMKDLIQMRMSEPESERLTPMVDSIIRSVERCARITRRLLGFARHMGPDSQIETVDVAKVVDETVAFLANEATWRTISLECDVPSDLPQVTVDRGKLQQILINLLNNAFSAVDSGDEIMVKVRLRASKLTVIVSDTGCGISESDLKSVFEPFFTTRSQTGGTGLGLSITYGLVKEMNGDIKVDSTLGTGTTFTITLPTTTETKGQSNASTSG